MNEYFLALQSEPFAVSLFTVVFAYVIGDCFVRFFYHAGRHLTIWFRGYPPAHCDSDGDAIESKTE
jgi:hypothetical protein